jgi:HlyD family secretion protein
VVSLADLNDLQVELDIAQADFARLGPNQKAIVTTDTYPDKTYDGVIAQISPEANRQKATVQVKVQVLNPAKYPDVFLRPEMNATVKFLADAPKAAFNGKAHVRDIHILSQRTDGFLVDGLVGGESVITKGPQDLKDGDSIKVKE